MISIIRYPFIRSASNVCPGIQLSIKVASSTICTPGGSPLPQYIPAEKIKLSTELHIFSSVNRDYLDFGIDAVEDFDIFRISNPQVFLMSKSILKTIRMISPVDTR